MQEPTKWEGEAVLKLPAATAEEVWAVAGDFFGVHKWLPRIVTCHKLDGEEHVPGCVRFCGGRVHWAKERLVALDPAGRTYSYDVIDSSMGFGQYSATFKVLPEEPVGTADGGGRGCRVEWAFRADPVEGLTRDGLVWHLQAALEALGRRFSEIKESDSLLGNLHI